MPYLKEDDKKRMLREWEPTTPGELNFLVTTLALRYWANSKQNYQAENDVIGALASATLEYYRRHVSVYENSKIHSNGDVFEDAIE